MVSTHPASWNRIGLTIAVRSDWVTLRESAVGDEATGRAG